MHLVQQTLDTERPTGLRERKKAARRAQLIDAAHRLVLERGYDHVTVDDIAAAAGVSTRTFFNYFETKDDAILVFDPWPTDEGASEVFASGGPTGDDATDVAALLDSVLGYWEHNTGRIATAMRLAATNPQLHAKHMAMGEQYRGALVGLFARRAGRTDPEPVDTLGAIAIVCLLRGASHLWECAGDGSRLTDHLPAVRSRIRELLGEPRPSPDAT